MNWKLYWLAVFVVIGLCGFPLESLRAEPDGRATLAGPKISWSDKRLKEAWEQGLSDFKIRCSGVVVRKLPDDLEGSRHQKFILQLATGQTLLVAHNIDLAPRVARLKLRDRLIIHGEYIWNEEGGIMHLTHRNPSGFGFHGWIRKNGKTYW
jgi:hypothetical protein